MYCINLKTGGIARQGNEINTGNEILAKKKAL
jgi:hypothetical protein